ncbi:MAG: IS1595 family transposase, partial [Gammaproteobacteria bacterium]|nr:IS1595 family transposase [Gammaproteobacteria bacterium]
MYLVQTSRKSISSLQLSKELDVTQKTAWFLLHRVREACKQGDWKLTNVVEVDETYVGGKERNKHNNKKLRSGRGPVGKQAVIGARERGGNVKARAISNTDVDTLKGFIHGNVEPGSTVFTDEHRGYLGLGGILYNHKSVKHSAKEYVNGMIHTNGIESVWAILKRGYTGTFHHFSIKHLQRYVDEFTFRLNEGNVDRDTIDRIKSVCAASKGKRLT